MSESIEPGQDWDKISEEELERIKNETEEQSTKEPSKTRAEIAGEDFAKIQIEGTKQKNDHKANFDQYLASSVSGEGNEIEESSKKEPNKTRAEIYAEDLAKMQIENTKYMGEWDESEMAPGQHVDNKIIDSQEKPREVEKEIVSPEDEKIENEKEKVLDSVEVTKEAKIREEEAINDLIVLVKKKESIAKEKKGQQGMLNKTLIKLGLKEGKPEINKEYVSIHEEYQKAIADLVARTGKSPDEVKMMMKERERGESAKEVNKNLDNIEKGLEEKEGKLSGEKKDLIERFTGIKDERLKLCIKFAIAGGIIALPVAGAAAAVFGLGLGEALVGFSIIKGPPVAILFSDLVFTAGAFYAGGGLLSDVRKKWGDLNKKENVSIKEAGQEEDSLFDEKSINVERLTEEIKKDVKGISISDFLESIKKEKKESIEGRENNKEENINPIHVEETTEEGPRNNSEIKDDEFTSVKSFEELYRKINKIGLIKYSDGKQLSSNEMINRINALRNTADDRDYNLITRNGGLRAKVKDLIEESKIEFVN